MAFCEKIAVFMGSSMGAKPEYAQAAQRMGELIALQGRALVFGGCLDGLMAVTAKSAHQHGARIYSEGIRGLIGEKDHLLGAVETLYDNVRERKHGLIAHADACVMLPGGMGTLDEFSEVCAAVQLGETNVKIGILNTAGYYDRLLDFIRHMREEGFLSSQWDRLFVAADTPEELLLLLDQ